jgi:flagellar biosynthesis/type III secretory pathway chaperone
MNRDDKVKTYYFKITDLWRRLCEEHSKLFDLTLDEYTHLLGSDIEKVEEITKQKEEIIVTVQSLEEHRAEIIGELNKDEVLKVNVENIKDLIEFMDTSELEKEQKHFHNFNSLLIDIIEKIQKQNKKNQVFINKAIKSLRDIREGAMGEKSYSTYTSSGTSKMRSIGSV